MICDIWFKSIKELDDVVENYWRLKAIDLLDISDEFTDEERNRIVNSLFNTASNLLIAKEHKLPKTAQYLKKQ